MTRTTRHGVYSVVALAAATVIACGGPPPPTEEAPPEAEDQARLTRLYVFDCGYLRLGDPTEFSLSLDEMSTLEAAVPCFLVEHERGTLMWDLGFADAMAELPDGETVPEGPLAGTLLRRDRTLEIQLAELGHAPGDIDYFAMSHMHFDHAGNANAFRESTWLAREAERDFAFGDVVGLLGWDPTVYEALREVDPILIEGDHDVFGDGSVVIKSAPGHTPGHQVLFVDLAETGPIVLSGDLYHFPESRELGRVPLFNDDEEETRASMDAIEAFLVESGAELWIEHDFTHNATLRKSPEFYQ